MLTYLALDLFTLLGPLARSFEPRINYYGKWKALLPGIFMMAAVFLTWDYFFTKWGIWSFSHEYTLPIRILGMPLEEWLFFIVVPYACIFIYEVFKYFVKIDFNRKLVYFLTFMLAIGLAVIGFMNLNKLYTSVTFIGTAGFLLVVLATRPSWLGYFFIGYAISIIPFFLVNGVLTYLPVVSYNDAENLGLRLVSIPIEDSVYMLLMLLMSTSIYEYLKNRFRLN